MYDQARLMAKLTFCSASFDMDMTALYEDISGN